MSKPVVYIRGIREEQDIGTTLHYFRQNFPGCWLVDHGNRTRAHRSNTYALQDGKEYDLIESGNPSFCLTALK